MHANWALLGRDTAGADIGGTHVCALVMVDVIVLVCRWPGWIVAAAAAVARPSVVIISGARAPAAVCAGEVV